MKSAVSESPAGDVFQKSKALAEATSANVRTQIQANLNNIFPDEIPHPVIDSLAQLHGRFTMLVESPELVRLASGNRLEPVEKTRLLNTLRRSDEWNAPREFLSQTQPYMRKIDAALRDMSNIRFLTRDTSLKAQITATIEPLSKVLHVGLPLKADLISLEQSLMATAPTANTRRTREDRP